MFLSMRPSGTIPTDTCLIHFYFSVPSSLRSATSGVIFLTMTLVCLTPFTSHANSILTVRQRSSHLSRPSCHSSRCSKFSMRHQALLRAYSVREESRWADPRFSLVSTYHPFPFSLQAPSLTFPLTMPLESRLRYTSRSCVNMRLLVFGKG